MKALGNHISLYSSQSSKIPPGNADSAHIHAIKIVNNGLIILLIKEELSSIDTGKSACHAGFDGKFQSYIIITAATMARVSLLVFFE